MVYTFIAFFRGINVGGHNSLPMRELSELLGNMGLENIKTYIQSGNVIFQSTKQLSAGFSADISLAVEKLKGFKPGVLLLSPKELQTAIDKCPFSSDEGKLLHFFFLSEIPEEPDLESLEALKSETEEYRLINKVFYLYAPDGIGRSKLVAKVGKAMGVPGTARNWNTVRKIRSLVDAVC